MEKAGIQILKAKVRCRYVWLLFSATFVDRAPWRQKQHIWFLEYCNSKCGKYMNLLTKPPCLAQFGNNIIPKMAKRDNSCQKWYIRNWMLQFKIYESTHKTTMFGIKTYLPKMAETQHCFPQLPKWHIETEETWDGALMEWEDREREETETESLRDGISKWSTNKMNIIRAQTEWGDRDGAGIEWGKEWENPHDNSILTLYMTISTYVAVLSSQQMC